MRATRKDYHGTSAIVVSEKSEDVNGKMSPTHVEDACV